MTSPAPHGAPAAGRLAVAVELEYGRVRGVTTAASRPTALSQLFVGREPSAAPRLAGGLFALCGVAQAGAARMAVAAASGDALSTRKLGALQLAIVAERVFEILRASALEWPGGVALSPGEAAALRGAGEAARRLAAAVDRAEGEAATDAAEAADRLERAARTLGVPPAPGEPPAAELRFAAMLADCRGAGDFAAYAPDPLAPTDDRAVVAALAAAPAAFAARPALPGRVVETGAFARLGGRPAAGCSPLVARLTARLDDLVAALGEIRAFATEGAPMRCGDLSSGAIAPSLGYGAVETARGRLYHLVGIAPEGRVGGYGIVAPTEWNFHPGGPFVRTLVGARIGGGEAARLAAARLAALFDPCVGFDVSLREAAGA